MKPSSSIPNIGLLTFRHTPLDRHQSSIFLVSLFPSLSQMGSIQCEVSRSFINSRYHCVSYIRA
ncbi:hypothetical protein M3J09_005488 [Ascochyta lentis]